MTAHDQYYDDRDQGSYMREVLRGTGYDIDQGQYTDPDDSMSIQDLAVMRGHEAGDEDLHDYDEETYNEMLMDTGDF